MNTSIIRAGLVAVLCIIASHAYAKGPCDDITNAQHKQKCLKDEDQKAQQQAKFRAQQEAKHQAELRAQREHQRQQQSSDQPRTQALAAATGSISGKLHKNSASGPALDGVWVSSGGKSAFTNADGKFKLDGIAAGNTTIGFSRSGYHPYQGNVSIVAGTTVDMGERWLTEWIMSTPAQPLAAATGSISGKLHKNSASGSALDGVSVTSGDKSATTDKDGKFKLDGIAVGNTTIAFSRAGYNTYQGSVNIVAGQTANLGERWLTEKVPPAAGNTYDYMSVCPASGYDNVGKPGRPDKWDFFQCECTSYVADKLNEKGVPFGNSYKNVKWHDASNWVVAAKSVGISVDANPKIGDVAWFSYGHVAYVDSVDSTGNVTISEYNYNYPKKPYLYNSRSINKGTSAYPKHFIHL